MRNLLLIIACIINLSFVLAQDNFTVKSIDNKDIHFLSLPNSEFTSVGSVRLNEDDLKNVSSLEDRFKIAGIIDKPELLGSKILGYPVIGNDFDLESLAKKYQNALVTVGQIKSALARIKLYDLAIKAGFTLLYSLS